MFVLLLFLTLVSFTYCDVSQLPRCPYPLVEDIEPCACHVDEKYRMILTCHFNSDFREESFNRITSAFDYSNEIYSFDIDLQSDGYHNYFFHPQLNAGNLGKLNITVFSLKKAEIPTSLFDEGAFDGSAGSIQNITIEDIKTYETNGSIDLGSHVLHPACSTLQSLKLELVSQLSSTSLVHSPNLEEISLQYSTIPNIPSSLFSPEIIPMIQSISVGVSVSLSLQTDTFKDLPSLSSLEISTSKIDMIRSYAFNNLTNLQSIELSGINIAKIEEDAFKDLTSLTSLVITQSDIEVLPRLFSNSPSLTTFSLTYSKLLSIAENAFNGVPALQQLDLRHNIHLQELKISNLENLTSVNLRNNNGISFLSMDNLSSIESVTFSDLDNTEALSINIENCQSINSLNLRSSNLVNLELHNVSSLTNLDLGSNRNLHHTGLGSSLNSIINSEANIALDRTNVRNLDEFVFRPLLETFTSAESSSGYIDMRYVNLDCGCDVKWIIEDFHFQTNFFKNAYCTEGGSLAQVDPILLDAMCPP